MRRRQWLRATIGWGAWAGAQAAGAARALHWDRRLLTGFGTTLSLQAGHEDARALAEALDAGVAELRAIERQMSLFDAGSALSRLNRDGRLDAPPDALLAVLRTAQEVARGSRGAFDVTVQPLWNAFAEAARAGRLPTPRVVAAARALVGWQGLDLQPGLVRLARPGMGVTLNGIAQGFAADRVRGVLAAHGVRHALVDTGEFAPLGRNPAAAAWSLGIADPHAEQAVLARLMADGRCVATSADSLTTFSADRRHHHIFDPHTGYSPTTLSAVTVAADSGALADALTKVVFVAGPAQVPALARQWGVDVLWVDKRGQWWATGGLELE